MMTEFELRRIVGIIRVSEDTPLGKARRLVRLRRVLRTQVAELEGAKRQVARTRDRSTQALLARMQQFARSMEEDVRETAREALAGHLAAR